MEHWLWILLAALFFGKTQRSTCFLFKHFNTLLSCTLRAVKAADCSQTDNVQQPGGDVTAAEGDTVTLGCHFNSSSSNYYLFWYKQDGSNRPTFILSRFKIGTGTTAEEFKERFSSSLDSESRSVPLKIQKLHVSDSAVYYCALHEKL
uniref:Ig-like domain-containing protein n=1 Tax=Oryzias latipes TaxID=8090 RepID=A0A3P9JCE1_ORYLA